jgi:hypothetical protein
MSVYNIKFTYAHDRASAAHLSRLSQAQAVYSGAVSAAAAVYAAAGVADLTAYAVYDAALKAADATKAAAVRASEIQLQNDVRAIERTPAILGRGNWADSGEPYTVIAGNADPAVRKLVTDGYVLASDEYTVPAHAL